MKGLFVFCALLILGLAGCREKELNDPLAFKMTEQSAKNDFLVFKNILQSAHPSLSLYKSDQRIRFLFDSIDASLSGSISLKKFYSDLYFLCDEIGCSHTDVYLPDHIYDTLQNRKFFFPYPVLWIENKLLVNALGYDLPQGSEIVSINGTPVKQVLNTLLSYNSVEGFHRQTQVDLAAKDFSFEYYLNFGPQETFLLKVKDTLGITKTIVENSITYGEWNDRNSYDKYYFDGVDVDYDLSINNEKGYAVMKLPTFEFTGYQKQTAFENFCANSFDLLEKKKNIHKLIIDLRENGGGRLYGAFLLFSYLAKNSFSQFDYVSSKIKTLPYQQYLDNDFAAASKTDVTETLRDEFIKNKNGSYYYADSLNTTWKPAAHRFAGQIFVITNAATVSAASYFALLVKKTGIGKVVGVETAGGSFSGNGFKNLAYTLPASHIKLMFPYAHIVYSHKEIKNTGRGVLPDYNVPDTYESFKNNNDKQLLYILDSLNLN